jgi:hypothetical protein
VLAGIIGGRREWTALTISLGSIPCRYVRPGGPKVGVPELALDDIHRHTLAGEFDRVSMPELMRRKATADTCLGREQTQFAAHSSGRPGSVAGRAVEDAKQRPER